MLNRVAGIQMTSGHDIKHNLAIAKSLINEAVRAGAGLVVLPEMFALMGIDQGDKVKHKEELGQGLIQDFLQAEALDHGIWLVGGTIPIAIPGNEKKVRAACLVFNDKGERVARYDKIHLFDITLSSGLESYSESNTIEPGNEVVVITTPFGRLGLGVCYDLRFPELFRHMHEEKIEILALVSAFTYTTGLLHWDVLVKTRAIENQIYVIASCQTGIHSSARKTYGHSMIVDPWGEVKANLGEEEGVVIADIDLNYLEKIRKDFPALLHRKL